MMKLSPPYGDCTGYSDRVNRRQEFSPPYGDGIKWAMQNQTYSVFSPPCGDRTENGTKLALVR